MSIQDITVIITSFRSGTKIRNCIQSIDKQIRVILVENSNDLEFKKNIEKEFDNVECILTGANLGYGRANNIGLKIVRTKYALILNPDTTLHKDAIENFLKVTQKIREFAIIGPYIQEEKNYEEKNNFDDLTAVPVINVKGFAMFLNLSEFKDIGFFDEIFFFYFEEIDLCKRLVDKGKKIYLVPSIKINHGGGQSHDKLINKEMELSRNWHWMWSTFNYHKKYKGFFISFFIVLPKFINTIAKVAFFTLVFNKTKKRIYYQRFSGLLNSIIGRRSWYRPKI